MPGVLKPGKFVMNPSQEENYLPPAPDTQRKLRILVAPLDWGLGHATRCIPIIYELIKQGCEVWLAGEGAQKALLRLELPDLPFLDLPGYRIRYGRTGATMLWQMAWQSRKITRMIAKENEWLKNVVDEFHFNAVISDNRYGLHHPKIRSVFITHQLTIKSPLGNWSERLLQKKNYSYIKHFTECWVPDTEEAGSLAGILSHPQVKPPVQVRYIGPLSRFETSANPLRPGHLLFVLSGPEPQRTLLENAIVRDIAHYPGAAVIARGLPASANVIPSTNTIKFYNHLPAEAMNKEMIDAEYVISRSGYSTVMDIMKLGKKSILVPTPGQTEQEYLGKYLAEKKLALCISQKSFSLNEALQQATNFPYQFLKTQTTDTLRHIIAQFISTIH